eukprot:scaffold7210_cov101-Skeletonema_dohrnii-CCMP3373.AAC.6
MTRLFLSSAILSVSLLQLPAAYANQLHTCEDIGVELNQESCRENCTCFGNDGVTTPGSGLFVWSDTSSCVCKCMNDNTFETICQSQKTSTPEAPIIPTLVILKFRARVWELQPMISVLQTVRNISQIAIVQLTFWKRLVIVYKTTTLITARLFAVQEMMAIIPLLANRLESSMVIPVPNVANNTLRNEHLFQMLLSLVATTKTSRLAIAGP